MKTKRLVLLAALAALTYVCTAFIQIPLPANGYFHLGDTMIVVAAVLLGAKGGAAVGAVGSTLADLTVAPLWAPFTFVIKGLIGALVGTAQKRRTGGKVICYVIGLIVLVGGYYAAEGILYGNWIAPMVSVPWSLLQYVASLILGLAISKLLDGKVNLD